MAEDLVPFNAHEAPRPQRLTHAHVGETTVTLHAHPLTEGEGKERGITVDLDTLRAIANQLYWKKPGTVEARKDVPGANLGQVDCQIGQVVLQGDGFREVVAAPDIALIQAVLLSRREAERRRAMLTHTARVSKHLGGTYP